MLYMFYYSSYAFQNYLLLANDKGISTLLKYNY